MERVLNQNKDTSGRKWEKVGNMFFGQFEHTLDDKGRLMIPSKMREELGNKLFILKGFDGCLSVYKNSDFEKLVSNINKLPFNQKNSRDFIRNQLASVSEIDVDKVGRMLIPTQIIAKYSIKKEVTIIGVGDHFEIWNRDTYLEYEKQVNDSVDTIAESLPLER